MLSFEEKFEKAKAFNRKFVAAGKASAIATKDMVKADELTPEQISELVEVYPTYSVGTLYQAGDLFQHEGQLIEVIQSHTSQSDWDPLSSASLYKIKTPFAVISEWVQPAGGHDSYKIGDKVLYEGKAYESTIDGNVWSPTGYPQGWSLING